MPVTRLTATISAGQSISNVIDCADDFVVGIIMPTAWTNAPVSFSLSLEGDNFYDLHNFRGSSSSPTELVFNVKPNAIVAVHPDTMSMARYLRVRSGISDEPVPQASTRMFGIVTINRVATMIGIKR